jgi:hypothetical protein
MDLIQLTDPPKNGGEELKKLRLLNVEERERSNQHYENTLDRNENKKKKVELIPPLEHFNIFV